MRTRFLLLLGILSCTGRAPLTVEVERGIPASQFAMRITETNPGATEHPIEMIRLDLSPGGGRQSGSDGTPVWVAAHIKGQPYLRPPVRLRVSDSLPGYASSAPPPLMLGRYEVRATAGGVTARTRFRVNERGQIE